MKSECMIEEGCVTDESVIPGRQPDVHAPEAPCACLSQARDSGSCHLDGNSRDDLSNGRKCTCSAKPTSIPAAGVAGRRHSNSDHAAVQPRPRTPLALA